TLLWPVRATPRKIETSGGPHARRCKSLMRHLLPIIAAANFTASLSIRSLDPLLPQISHELGISTAVVALLTSATAAAFLMTQLPVGIVADSFGKPRLI